jgi:phosphohistidine phosphatase
MSCTLYVVRHAIAEDRSESGRDADRRLTREGVAKMRLGALGLKRLGVEPQAIWSSPLPRAWETAEIVRDALAPALKVIAYPPLAPGGRSEALIAGLAAAAGARELILVGHEPDLGELASQLLTGAPHGFALAFKKGAACAIELAGLPPESAGTLAWFLTPKQLRALGGE